MPEFIVDEEEIAEIAEEKVTVHLCDLCIHEPKTCNSKPNATNFLNEDYIVSKCCYHRKTQPQEKKSTYTIDVYATGDEWSGDAADIEKMCKKIRSEDPDDKLTKNELQSEEYRIAISLMNNRIVDSEPIPMTAERIRQLSEKTAKETQPKRRTIKVQTKDIDLGDDFEI